MLIAEIISVGNELLSGATLNTNTVYLARNLVLMGFDVHWQSVVSDDENDVIDAVRLAGTRSHIIVVTGGLGPTDDDCTKQAVAKAFNLPLEESAEAVETLRNFFGQRGVEMPDSNLKQALVIKGSDVLQNPNGTAPGMVLKTATQMIALMPGPPREMEPMFENELKPHLAAINPEISMGRSLHIFGIGESVIEERIKDLLYGENPRAALYAKPGEVYLDIAASGATQEETEQRMEALIGQVKERIGEFVYSEDGKTMPETVVDILNGTGQKIAVAESCTGGLMAARITEVPGSSKVFDYGLAAYADWVKQQYLSVDKMLLRKYSAISSAAAAEMAKGARARGNADIGVGITGIAGPGTGDYIDKPVGLIYIAVCDKKNVIVKKFNFSRLRNRRTIRDIAVISAFDMVRRMIAGLEIAGSKSFAINDLADDERQGKPKKKSTLKAQKTALLSILAVLAVTGAFLSVRAIVNRVNSSVYNEIKSIYATDDTGGAAITGLQSLSSNNGDTVGWLSAPGSALDCVVVQDTGDGYYETHDFNKHRNKLGCLYVDATTDLQSSPRNVVIYGNSSDPAYLFGPLKSYTDLTYIEHNYDIEFNSLYFRGNYTVVSVFYANADPDSGAVQDFYLKQDFPEADDFKNFVVELKMRSMISIDVSILEGDSFLTLVTELPDWPGARLVVIARRVRESETAGVTSAMLSRNVAATYPEAWYAMTGSEMAVNEVVERDRWLNWMIVNEKNAGLESGTAGSGGIAIVTTTPYDPVTTDSTGAVQLTVNMNGTDITDSPLNIISRMVTYEIGSNTNKEYIKAQAVACASWLWYNFSSDGVPQVMGKAPSESVVAIVSEVIGEGLYYDGQIAFTPYFDISGGNTFSALDVWDMDLPYLVSVESRFDYLTAGYSRDTTYSRDALKSRLEEYYNITLSDDMSRWIVIDSNLAGGAVGRITIDGKVETTGTILREKCLTTLRSANFTLTVLQSSVVFTTYGYGHGVGMSKAGAQGYAQQSGWDYKQILAHYYPGTTLAPLDWTNKEPTP